MVSYYYLCVVCFRFHAAFMAVHAGGCVEALYNFIANVRHHSPTSILLFALCTARQLRRYLSSANHTCGNFAPDVDEVAVSGLSTLPSSKVRPARIAEAAVHMECQVSEAQRDSFRRDPHRLLSYCASRYCGVTTAVQLLSLARVRFPV